MKLTQRKIETLECPAGEKDALVFDDEQARPRRPRHGERRQELSGAIHARGAKATHPARFMLGNLACGRAGGRAGQSSATWRRAATRPPIARKPAQEARRKATHDALTLEALLEQWETPAPRREARAIRSRGGSSPPLCLRQASEGTRPPIWTAPPLFACSTA